MLELPVGDSVQDEDLIAALLVFTLVCLLWKFGFPTDGMWLP